jgi:hypothetical protein
MASLKMMLQDKTTHMVYVEPGYNATVVDMCSPTWQNTFCTFFGYEDKIELWDAIRTHCTTAAHAAGFTPVIRVFVENNEVKRVVGERPPKGNTADHFEL